MKRILAIAMCLVLTAAAVQVSAQNRGENNRQAAERDRQAVERDRQTAERNRQAVERDRQAAERNNRQVQERRTPEQSAKMRADRMKERLDLTDAQYAQVLELFKKQIEKYGDNIFMSREEMDKLTDEQKAERREEMKKMREEQDAKLKEILTEEQFAKRNIIPQGLSGRVGGQRSGERDSLAAERNNRQEQRTHEEAAKMQADRLKEQLDLTDAQYAQVFELFMKLTEKYGDNTPMSHEDTSNPTKEQRAERREKMKNMRNERDAKLKEILTEEQFAKYEEELRKSEIIVPYGNRSKGDGLVGGQRDGERPSNNRNQ